MAKAYAQIEHELAIIEQLGFPGYFLVVWELSQFCRDRGILSQGRGSAANSVVCYVLGVTAVDPIRYGLLFERFLSPERDGPPDIDVDIESDRREEVIQFVYDKHGREYAAQVANVITDRARSAVRDVAKALGYAPGQQDAWAKQVSQWSTHLDTAHANSTGSTGSTGSSAGGSDLATEEQPGTVEMPPLLVELANQLADASRHLGIHSGGMVICDRPIIEVCPVEWGRMPGRTVLQWDKDDCAAIGLTKFDLLGLGMLSALRYTFELVEAHHGVHLELHDIPADDPAVYDALCAADTVGVFQVESRAQQATLPRLKPRTFHDLAIEIALIRPGPIQGQSVHPYLRRRNGQEPVTYPHPDLEPYLAKTLGVPLFQEQLMQVAITAAGFTAGEADQLRRAMGSKRSTARMEAMRQRLYDGLAAHGITGKDADDIYTAIQGFAHFGFPESHSISFAYLALASTWCKVYYPAAFLAGLIKAQPMGFYSVQELVHDARRHGVVVLGPDLQRSQADAGLEPTTPDQQSRPGSRSLARSGLRSESRPTYVGPGPAQPAVRLGLASVRTIGKDLAARIVADRDANGPYLSGADLSHRIGLSRPQLEALATAGALGCFTPQRRQALWAAALDTTQQPGQLRLERSDEHPPTRANDDPKGHSDTSKPGNEHRSEHRGEQRREGGDGRSGDQSGDQSGEQGGEARVVFPPLTVGEQMSLDLWGTGVSEIYPTSLLQPQLDARGILPAAALPAVRHHTRITTAGIVTHRQRPGSAQGVTFISLADETGLVNVIVPAPVWKRYARIAGHSSALVVRGMIERADGATNLLAEHFEPLAIGVPTTSRDFR